MTIVRPRRRLKSNVRGAFTRPLQHSAVMFSWGYSLCIFFQMRREKNGSWYLALANLLQLRFDFSMYRFTFDLLICFIYCAKAVKALGCGWNVFMFSDNVTLNDEVQIGSKNLLWIWISSLLLLLLLNFMYSSKFRFQWKNLLRLKTCIVYLF